MKQLYFLLDKIDPSSKSVQKILDHPIAKKSLFNFSAAIAVFFATILVICYIMFSFSGPITRPVEYLDPQNGQVKSVITVPYPQQSYKSLQIWVTAAVRDLNSLSFNSIEADVLANRKYFLDDAAFEKYVNTLNQEKIIQNILKNSIKMTAVPLKDPVQISVQDSGENTYWLFRVPILVTYITGNQKPTTEQKLAEILIVRVPAYKNHNGLAIARLQFS